MNAATVLARDSSRAPDRRIARQLARFAWRHRAAVASLAERHTRLADLAVSFPALLFSLAVPRRGLDPQPVIERVIAGAALAELAGAARIPLWTRKLEPETFQRPLPWLPDTELFRRQIGNHLPLSAKTASRWIDLVAQAGFWGHDGLAIWFARRVGQDDINVLSHWKLLALWAWHSANTSAPASRFLTKPWKPEISSAQAMFAAREWRDNVGAALLMGEAIVADPWAEPAVVDGYAFEPILTIEELIEAARTFNNCARTYAESIGAGGTRFWLVKRDAKPTAMLNLYADPVPTLNDVSGPGNRSVSADVWLATHRWLRSSSMIRTTPKPVYRGICRHQWLAMWRPYWLAKRRFPEWLPLAPVKSPSRWLEQTPGRRRRRRRPLL